MWMIGLVAFYFVTCSYPTFIYLDTWILGVASKQLRLLHGRVGDSTTLVNSLSPQMSELVEDAIASWCGYIVGHFWLIEEAYCFFRINIIIIIFYFLFINIIYIIKNTVGNVDYSESQSILFEDSNQAKPPTKWVKKLETDKTWERR